MSLLLHLLTFVCLENILWLDYALQTLQLMCQSGELLEFSC